MKINADRTAAASITALLPLPKRKNSHKKKLVDWSTGERKHRTGRRRPEVAEATGR